MRSYASIQISMFLSFQQIIDFINTWWNTAVTISPEYIAQVLDYP
jgi:hypothetical protein